MTIPAPADACGAVRLNGVSKTYPGTRALDEVSFAVVPGAVHALLGGNGSGKSTLVKILAGVVRADPGSSLDLGGHAVDLHRWSSGDAWTAGLRFVHQNPGLLPGMSVAENLAIGTGYLRRRTGRIDWAAQHRRARAILDRFRIRADSRTPIDALGPATQTMIAIARALWDRSHSGEGMLVLDEPTAALPRSEVDLLLGAIRGFAAAGQTILLVSHRLDEVLEVADDITVLRDGKHVATRPAVGLAKRDLAAMIVGHDVGGSSRPSPEPMTDAAPVLSVTDSRPGPEPAVTLHVRPGEIVGIAGLLGSGRTTLLRTIFGATPARSVMIRVDGKPVAFRNPREAMANGVAYVPDDRAASAAFPNLTVRSNLSMANVAKYWRSGWFDHGDEGRDSAAAIAAFSIKCASDREPLLTLSGGNQQKVVLARWLRREPRLLLLDEPTQGVDVGARAEIARLIHQAASRGTAVVVTSSDFEELIELSDTIAVVANGRIVDTFPNLGLRVRDLTEAVYGGRRADR